MIEEPIYTKTSRGTGKMGQDQHQKSSTQVGKDNRCRHLGMDGEQRQHARVSEESN